MLPNFSYVKARSLDDAVRRAAGPDARVMAGGTDLLGCLRDGVLPAAQVVSLRRPRRTEAGAQPRRRPGDRRAGLRGPGRRP